MAFQQRIAEVPTNIGEERFSLRDNQNEPHLESITFLELDAWQPLEHDNLYHFAGVSVVRAQTVFVEDTDYEINYVTGEIRALSSGGITLDGYYRIAYGYHLQEGRFSVDILNQAGEVMGQQNGNLISQLTPGEKTTISTFLTTLRGRAFDEIINPSE
jgi:hypothetical protein